MRTLSAAAIKRRRCHSRTRPAKDTIIGNVYDKLMLNRGKGVDLSFVTPKTLNTLINQLIDFYGLDIRHCGRGKYILVGEWFGSTYIDYFAENISLGEQ